MDVVAIGGPRRTVGLVVGEDDDVHGWRHHPDRIILAGTQELRLEHLTDFVNHLYGAVFT